MFFHAASSATLSLLLTLLLCFVLPQRVALAVPAVKLPVEITSGTGTTLSNHSTRLILNNTTAPGFDWSYNCADIQVFDSNGNALSYFLERCDPLAQEARIWIKIPTIPAAPGSIALELQYNDPAGVSLSNAASTFTDSGIRYHTQPYNTPSPGPQSREQGDTIFDYETVTSASGYGCRQLSNVNVDNSGVFGSNSSIGYHWITIFDVNTSGLYEFRYGMDYGDGGEISIDGSAVEADWLNDLWWGFNYNHVDVLTGTRSLNTGSYTFDSLGFEHCCDGPAGMQYRILPGGNWQTFSSASTDFTLYAPDCPYEESTIKTGESQSLAELAIDKQVSSASPSIGEQITFTLKISNDGPFDAHNVTVNDPLPDGFTGITNISHAGTFSNGNVNWMIPSVPAGSTVSVTFDALVSN